MIEVRNFGDDPFERILGQKKDPNALFDLCDGKSRVEIENVVNQLNDTLVSMDQSGAPVQRCNFFVMCSDGSVCKISIFSDGNHFMQTEYKPADTLCVGPESGPLPAYVSNKVKQRFSRMEDGEVPEFVSECRKVVDEFDEVFRKRAKNN
jgi:hypothetical protein